MAITVAVLNANDDVVEMLRAAIQQAGFNTATAHVTDIKRGEQDFLSFLKEHDPRVIVYDIAPPYHENWTFSQLLNNTEAAKNRTFVLTTANKALLQEVAGSAIDVFEVSEKPDTLARIVDAVKRSAGNQ
jgi:DNA-binding NtrC family response regulator